MKVDEAYNIWADQYDSNRNKTRDLDALSTIKTLEKYDYSRVIELGCGTGMNTVYLLKKASKVIGLDFSEEMLNKAKEKIKDNRAEILKTDLTTDRGIEDNYADLITCNLVLEHINDLDVVFHQANKKLKNGGSFYISELHPFKQYLRSKARFETENGTHELETFVHHISEYLKVAKENGFELIALNAWFDKEQENKIPRLIGL